MKNVLLMCVVLLFSIVIGCKKDTVTAPTEPQNLIPNSSFETNGGPSVAAWQFRDSSIFEFAQEVPPGGGSYSIVLQTVRPSSFSMNSLIMTVPLTVGSHRYRLSSWAKRTTHGGGFIALFRGPGDIDTMTAYQTIVIVDSVWTHYSTEMLLANSSNDSVVVALNGGYSPISYLENGTFFDLCKFERFD